MTANSTHKLLEFCHRQNFQAIWRSQIARHQLGIRCIYLTGNANDPANKEFRVWYSVIGQGETPPANPEELSKSFFTKRKKDIIDFEFGDSGKTAWFSAQVENEGKKGPWGPLVSAP